VTKDDLPLPRPHHRRKIHNTVLIAFDARVNRRAVKSFLLGLGNGTLKMDGVSWLRTRPASLIDVDVALVDASYVAESANVRDITRFIENRIHGAPGARLRSLNNIITPVTAPEGEHQKDCWCVDTMWEVYE